MAEHDDVDDVQITPDETYATEGTVDDLTEEQLDQLESEAAQEDADEQIARSSTDG